MMLPGGTTAQAKNSIDFMKWLVSSIRAMPPRCATYVVLSASGLSTFTTIMLRSFEERLFELLNYSISRRSVNIGGRPTALARANYAYPYAETAALCGKF